MKDRTDAILQPRQADYLDGLLPPREPLLAALEEAAAAEGVPISDPEVGLLLEILARGVCRDRRGHLLEIGTAIGYGTLRLARGAEAARVTSIEFDPMRLERARDLLERAGVGDRVELLEGRALDVLPTLDGPFDLVYIDAVKTEYRAYLDLVLPKLVLGGLVVLDNLLWKGWVADPPPDAARDDATEALRAVNGYLTRHPALRALVLPHGDGLGVAVRIV
ncbi:MAG: O-methyltransferase [Acidobacteriota bacterium]